jgi:hypothetical protein
MFNSKRTRRWARELRVAIRFNQPVPSNILEGVQNRFHEFVHWPTESLEYTLPRYSLSFGQWNLWATHCLRPAESSDQTLLSSALCPRLSCGFGDPTSSHSRWFRVSYSCVYLLPLNNLSYRTFYGFENSMSSNIP